MIACQIDSGTESHSSGAYVRARWSLVTLPAIELFVFVLVKQKWHMENI